MITCIYKCFCGGNWEWFQITALDILVMFLFFLQCAEQGGFINFFFFQPKGTGAKYLVFVCFFFCLQGFNESFYGNHRGKY